MRKVVSSKQILASTTLAAALAVFGCTSNKMPGDGQPTSMPYSSPATAAPTNGTSGGTRPGTSGGMTPMISSGPASMTSAAVDNFALVAQQQGFRGRIIGPSLPGQADISSSMQPTGQFQNPALVANPEITVNRSISSEPTPAYINDTGAGLTIVSGGGTTGTTGAITSAATVAGTGTSATAPMTTASAASASPSQVVIGTPTPTQSSIGVPSPAFAANPATVVRSNSGRTVTTTTAAAAVAARPATTSPAIGNLTIPSAASLPTMISSSGSTGPTVTSASTITPVTTTAAQSRTRAVRLTTAPNGTLLITNAPNK